MKAKFPHILIADDDEEDLELMEEAILSAESNALLHKVRNGKALIEFLDSSGSNQLPHLIIMDYNMPELNGAEVLSQLRRRPYYTSIPVVILSTSNAPLHQQECKANGASEYFVKPHTLRELDELAEKILAFCSPF